MSEPERDAGATVARSFGEELRRERELRQISLREVAEATKINLRFLEALENNDFDMLPGGFFTRGFIKSYARHIGLNEEALVNAYLMELNQQRGRASAPAPPATPEPEPPPARPAPAAAGRAGGAGVRGVTVGASLLAFFGLAFLLWNGVRQLGQGAAMTGGSPVPAAPAAAPASESPAPAAAIPERLDVDVALSERAWIRVLCDGREMVNRTLEAGSRRRFECAEEVSISASDVGALEVEVNERRLRLPGGAGQRLTPFLVRRLEWPPALADGAAAVTP